jgi:hypothetical protein
MGAPLSLDEGQDHDLECSDLAMLPQNFVENTAKFCLDRGYEVRVIPLSGLLGIVCLVAGLKQSLRFAALQRQLQTASRNVEKIGLSERQER